MTDKTTRKSWLVSTAANPAGWFDLLLIMIDGMLNNAGELESQPFYARWGSAGR